MSRLNKHIALILSIVVIISFCSSGFCKTGVRSKPHKGKKISAVKKAKKTVVPKKKPAAKRSQKQVYLKSTAPSQIYILSASKEAEIYIDEDSFGKAPVNIKDAKPGKHLVEAYVGKELLFRQYVIVEPGAASVVEIRGKKQVADEEKDHIIL